MGFPTKVQLIQRKDSQQWYINFPSAVAQAMEFSRGEIKQVFMPKSYGLTGYGMFSAIREACPNATKEEVMKRKNILDTGAAAVFTGNVGCLLQIGRYLRAQRPDLWVAHPIDALWASYSGSVNDAS